MGRLIGGREERHCNWYVGMIGILPYLVILVYKNVWFDGYKIILTLYADFLIWYAFRLCGASAMGGRIVCFLDSDGRWKWGDRPEAERRDIVT